MKGYLQITQIIRIKNLNYLILLSILITFLTPENFCAVCVCCFRQLEENLLETACLLPDDNVFVLRAYLVVCKRYNPLTVLNMAMMNAKPKYGRFLVDEMQLKFGGASGRFTFEVR